MTFADLKKLVKSIGFSFTRKSGSHEIYGRKGVSEIVNLQPRKRDKRMAKEYQVEQVVGIINKYRLEVKE